MSEKPNQSSLELLYPASFKALAEFEALAAKLSTQQIPTDVVQDYQEREWLLPELSAETKKTMKSVADLLAVYVDETRKSFPKGLELLSAGTALVAADSKSEDQVKSFMEEYRQYSNSFSPTHQSLIGAITMLDIPAFREKLPDGMWKLLVGKLELLTTAVTASRARNETNSKLQDIADTLDPDFKYRPADRPASITPDDVDDEPSSKSHTPGWKKPGNKKQ